LVTFPEMWHHYTFDQANNVTGLSPVGSQPYRLLHLGSTLIERDTVCAMARGVGRCQLPSIIGHDRVRKLGSLDLFILIRVPSSMGASDIACYSSGATSPPARVTRAR